jgi:hypothetical protein
MLERWLPHRGLHLSRYDAACGHEISAAFAVFQGMDPPDALSKVFAALVHRCSGGRDDGTCNPLLLEGAGWTGALATEDSHSGEGLTLFATLADGCRAAAVECQFPEYRAVQVAYRSGDPMILAASLEASPLRLEIDLAGFVEEVRGLLLGRGGRFASLFRAGRGRVPATPPTILAVRRD